MDSLSQEINRQKDRLEAVAPVTIHLDIDAAHPDRPYEGSVELYANDDEKTKVYLDLYDQEGSFKIESNDSRGVSGETFRRYTVPDVLLLVARLVHSHTGRRVDLDREHWPPCRVVLTREHLTARRERFSSTVTFRGDYFECLEELRSIVPPEGPPSDVEVEIKGDAPPKHTVEEPPSGPDWLHADAETEPDEGEVELPF